MSTNIERKAAARQQNSQSKYTVKKEFKDHIRNNDINSSDVWFVIWDISPSQLKALHRINCKCLGTVFVTTSKGKKIWK